MIINLSTKEGGPRQGTAGEGDAREERGPDSGDGARTRSATRTSVRLTARPGPLPSGRGGESHSRGGGGGEREGETARATLAEARVVVRRLVPSGPRGAGSDADTEKSSVASTPLLTRKRRGRRETAALGEMGASGSASPASSMRSATSRPRAGMTRAISSSDEEASPPEKLAILGPASPEKGGGKGGSDSLEAAKRELRAAQERLNRLGGDEGILDPNELGIGVPLRRRVADLTVSAMEEVGYAPTPDVAARALERVENVIKVSTVSKGLKGSLQAALRQDAAWVRACVATLAERARVPTEGEGHGRELEVLREELGASRAQCEALRLQMEELRRSSSRMPPPSPGPPAPLPGRGASLRASPSGAASGGRRGRAGPPDLGPGEGDSDPDVRMAPLPRERGVAPPMGEGVFLPPEEWPPAIRPAIRGVRTVLRDPPTDPPRWRREAAPSPRDLGEVVAILKGHMEGLFREWVGAQGAPQPTRRREASDPAPSLPPNPLVPGGGAGGGRKKGKKRGKGGPTLARAPPKGAARAGPSGGKTPLGAAASPALPPVSASRPSLPAGTQPPARVSTWAKVVGRRGGERLGSRGGGQGGKPLLPQTGGKKGAARAAPPAKGGVVKPAPKSPSPGKGPAAGNKKKKRRPPTSAAVTITCPEGKYEEVMREARSEIDLATLDIEALRTRRAVTGALIFEVAGEGGAAKADALAARLKGALARREDVRVARPVKMAELRVRDLDDSVRGEEVAAAMAAKGGCDPGEVRVGELKRAPNGLASAWVRCPLVAANKAATGGKIKVGWAMARLEVLEERPLTCYKCMGRGHVRASCTSEEDRSGSCYRCGQTGHVARLCEAQPHCTLCEKAGLPHGHRVGAKACKAPTRKRKGRTGPGSVTPGPPSANKEGRETGGTAGIAVPIPAQPPLREVASRDLGEGGLALPHPAVPGGPASFVFSPPISGEAATMEVDLPESTEPPKERRLPRVVAVKKVTTLVKVATPEEAAGTEL